MNCAEARVPVLLADAERAAAVVFADGVLVWKGAPVPAAEVRGSRGAGVAVMVVGEDTVTCTGCRYAVRVRCCVCVREHTSTGRSGIYGGGKFHSDVRRRCALRRTGGAGVQAACEGERPAGGSGRQRAVVYS